MDPNEAWIGKAIVAGGVLLLIFIVGALLGAKGEGARRIKIVLAVLLGLGALAFVIAVAGPGGLALALIAIGVITWIVRGFKS